MVSCNLNFSARVAFDRYFHLVYESIDGSMVTNSWFYVSHADNDIRCRYLIQHKNGVTWYSALNLLFRGCFLVFALVQTSYLPFKVMLTVRIFKTWLLSCSNPQLPHQSQTEDTWRSFLFDFFICNLSWIYSFTCFLDSSWHDFRVTYFDQILP